VFNVVITISVISVANSCAYGSTRTIQALAVEHMAPAIFRKIDKHGRPVWCVVLQLAFGLLAFINEATQGADFFNWLLALSGLAYFFVWGSICIAHVRFRAGWRAQGHSLEEIPYKAPFGVAGSYCGIVLCLLCLIATFYVAIFPVGGSPSASGFFQQYLTALIVLALYLGWKTWTRDWRLFIRANEMDITSGIRMNIDELREAALEATTHKTWKNAPTRFVRALV
jgi:yeast amino acid transporter